MSDMETISESSNMYTSTYKYVYTCLYVSIHTYVYIYMYIYTKTYSVSKMSDMEIMSERLKASKMQIVLKAMDVMGGTYVYIWLCICMHGCMYTYELI
jgi:hypothetical protein